MLSSYHIDAVLHGITVYLRNSSILASAITPYIALWDGGHNHGCVLHGYHLFVKIPKISSQAIYVSIHNKVQYRNWKTQRSKSWIARFVSWIVKVFKNSKTIVYFMMLVLIYFLLWLTAKDFDVTFSLFWRDCKYPNFETKL